MLGMAEPSLRRGFASGKTLVRRKSGAAQKGRFGFRRLLGGSTHLIAMLGRSEFALRQGFACGKTLVRRKGAAGQKAG